MAKPFLTVSDELFPHAEMAYRYFEKRGYTVAREYYELGYPYAPTLHCSRPPTTIFVEVASAIRRDRTTAWIGYTRSSSSDMRIALVMPSDSARSVEDENWMQEMGVGLYLCGDRLMREAIAPHDMSLNAQLPDLDTLSSEIQKLLGPVYEKFERSEWRSGFKDACQILETEAREYLKGRLTVDGIRFVDQKGKERKIGTDNIQRFTMGQLGVAFGEIEKQNYTDSAVGRALIILNQDRVPTTHHGSRPETEAQLRKNVGQHMWRVVAVLKELLGTK